MKSQHESRSAEDSAVIAKLEQSLAQAKDGGDALSVKLQAAEDQLNSTLQEVCVSMNVPCFEIVLQYNALCSFNPRIVNFY